MEAGNETFEPSTTLQDILLQYESLQNISTAKGDLSWSSKSEKSITVGFSGLTVSGSTQRNQEKKRSPPLLIMKEPGAPSTPWKSVQELFPMIELYPTPTESIKSTRESCRDGEYSIVAEYEKYKQLLSDDVQAEEFLKSKPVYAIDHLECYMLQTHTTENHDIDDLEQIAFTGLSAFHNDSDRSCENFRAQKFAEAESILRNISDYLDEMDVRALQSLANELTTPRPESSSSPHRQLHSI
jgi:hypothetical protein